jgi:hypothetical protein
MTTVLADDLLRSRLNNLAERLQICDEQGNILGFFVPAETSKEMYEQMEWPEWLTPAEMERLSKQTVGKPLAQIWKELGRS